MHPTVAISLLLLLFGCFFGVSECRWVDLTHAFDNKTHSLMPKNPLKVTVTYNGTKPQGFWYLSEKFCVGSTHTGTHMDAPCHYSRDGWCIDQIPLDRLVVAAVVVDICDEVGDDPDIHLTVAHLLEWESVNGEIPSGSLLLVRTGWSRFALDSEQYLGTTETDISLMSFPSITPEAATWLTTQRDIVGVGVDSVSIGRADVVEEIHVIFLQKNMYGLEHLTNLDLLPPTGARVVALPIKLKGAGGSPVRVVADVPD